MSFLAIPWSLVPISPATGAVPGSVLYISPTNTVEGSQDFKWDSATNRLRLGATSLAGAGIEFGVGGASKITQDAISVLSVDFLGTKYFRIGLIGAGSEYLSSFQNLSVLGASTNALFDISGTWNTTGAANGIRLNVTDTASAAGALLMDLRAGGVSRASVRKDAVFSLTTASGAAGGIAPDASFRGTYIFDGNGNACIVNTSRITVRSGAQFGFSPDASFPESTPDLSLFRDAADTLAQRRGVNAQTFRIYNTFTDASNYERGFVRWSANVLEIGSERAGTGTSRLVDILGDAGVRLRGFNNNPISFAVGVSGLTTIFQVTTSAFLAGADNSFDIGAAAANRPRNLFLGSYMQLSEMTAPAAPAANNVVIYAEDNGSGKTRLMARFATGAAQQIAIEP
jgi:hypothetical protein